MQHLQYRGQEFKTCNLHFTFLTHLWPWNEVKVIKPRMKMQTQIKVIIMQTVIKRLCFNDVWEKAKVHFFSFWEIYHLSPLNMCDHQKRLHDMTYLILLWNFNLMGLEHNIFKWTNIQTECCQLLSFTLPRNWASWGIKWAKLSSFF